MKLGILDIPGRIADTAELVQHAEAIGFSRYWLAEHQPQPSPLLTAMMIAGLTQSIRIGTAGILLHYYALQRTAHDFHLLERAHAGRIDAGFCPGRSPREDACDEIAGRNAQHVIESYPERAGEFIGMLRNVPAHPGWQPANAWPGVATCPEIWSMGGGPRSARIAAAHGVAYAYALMFPESRDDTETVMRYRDEFKPSCERDAPHVAIAVAGICAPTDELAEALAARHDNPYVAQRVVGSPARCVEALAQLQERYRADEIVFADTCWRYEEREVCYRLLAESARLVPQSSEPVNPSGTK